MEAQYWHPLGETLLLPVVFLEQPRKFELGAIYLTAAVHRDLPPQALLQAITRHAAGDWGEVQSCLRAENEAALALGGRPLVSTYSPVGIGILIVTQADRSQTTVMGLEDYLAVRGRFPVGDLEIAPEAVGVVADAEIDAALWRHCTGDWGNVTPIEREANEAAVRQDAPLRSRYRTAAGQSFLLETTADRRRTRVSLPPAAEGGHDAQTER